MAMMNSGQFWTALGGPRRLWAAMVSPGQLWAAPGGTGQLWATKILCELIKETLDEAVVNNKRKPKTTPILKLKESLLNKVDAHPLILLK